MAAIFSTFFKVGDYLRRSADPIYSEMIYQEHYTIVNLPIVDTCVNFFLPCNKNKNRCADYPCWDTSRVVLKSNNSLDYINANYVSGFDMSAKFIATQEPMPGTFNDFWKMIWQENSRVIVMLNGTKQQSEPRNLQYFAATQDNTLIKEFIIKEERVKLNSYYTKTTLKVTHLETGEVRVIHHFKYLNWPENEAPDIKEVIDFLLAVNRKDQAYFRKVLKTNQVLPGPIVVHGEKGVGRTAAYCVADICLYQIAHTASISVPSTVVKVRQQRRFSMQTANHYIFVNNLVLYFLVTLRSNIETYLELRSHINKSDVDLLFRS
ncbi:GSCOCT00013427001.2-RA-CDS [Cotesia congregata]|uniref:Cc_ptp.h_4.2 n=2 Tax=root TaxID=1 RepID=S6CWP9_COTCN|nr:PTPH [Bracoviriform congregatae]CAD6244697.1 GSCOCT00013427001.2-RA-CDS [Cotesia congregata]CAG17404.1 PTPH [Bracoviriform congregatae]CAG26728.1 protein tyrosine phosphatase [Bracoviriform congregatae]CAG5075864.1 cc_ptp.h_4.2 [Cotesia congregata]CCQ71362.1 protein tyrosine phosphatase PTPH [Cotesia congregata]